MIAGITVSANKQLQRTVFKRMQRTRQSVTRFAKRKTHATSPRR
jgi:hypothetical protein